MQNVVELLSCEIVTHERSHLRAFSFPFQQDRVNQFVSECLDQAKAYRTNNIMLSMGSDFQFSNANTWFKNMDKLLHYVKVGKQKSDFASEQSLLKLSVPQTYFLTNILASLCLFTTFSIPQIDNRINAFYSTPTIYTKAKHDAGVTWTTKVNIQIVCV